MGLIGGDECTMSLLILFSTGILMLASQSVTNAVESAIITFCFSSSHYC